MSVLERLSLEGETAIVTGAARGLGKQMATGLTDADTARRTPCTGRVAYGGRTDAVGRTN